MDNRMIEIIDEEICSFNDEVTTIKSLNNHRLKGISRFEIFSLESDDYHNYENCLKSFRYYFEKVLIIETFQKLISIKKTAKSFLRTNIQI